MTAKVLKHATWRSWVLPGGLLAVAVVLGLTWNPGGSIDIWIFKTGTAGATVAPLLLTGIYTASGNKWYSNDVGTALVQSLLSIIVITAPLAWAAWRDHGSITGGLVAWLEIAGPLLAAITILRLCWVFARIHRGGNGSSESG